MASFSESLLPTDADDDAVGVLCSFTLTTASRDPGMWGARAASLITPSSPAASKRSSHAVAASKARSWQARSKALAAAQQLGPPLLERAPVQLAVPQEQVEGDEDGRDLGGESADAALRRMESHLHRVEVEHPVACDHDLAVEGGMRR